jgi:hypothetical protein
VLGVADLWPLAAKAATRIDQVDAVQRSPTVVALIASGAVEAAVRAGSLDVAVRQVASVVDAIERLHCGKSDVAIPKHLEEELVDYFAVVVSPGPGKDVEADPEIRPGFEEFLVILVRYLPRGTLLLVRPNGDRGSMLVGAGQHEDVVPQYAMKPRKDIRR